MANDLLIYRLRGAAGCSKLRSKSDAEDADERARVKRVKRQQNTSHMLASPVDRPVFHHLGLQPVYCLNNHAPASSYNHFTGMQPVRLWY